MFGMNALAKAQSPVVEKVEPPNWWIGHTINPVRVLVRGTNFDGSVIRSASSGISVSNLKVNSRGDYLFVDVMVDPKATPGDTSFTIATSKGEAVVPFI